jgi:hypothetical protein
MKQILLATALIALPVAAFTGFNVFAAKATVSSAAATGLGDMSIFTTIITDVQADAAKGDFAAAKTRIKDFEIAWDDNSKGLRPLAPDHWDLIDGAADAALTAVRAPSPDAAKITETLAALQASMETTAVQK